MSAYVWSTWRENKELRERLQRRTRELEQRLKELEQKVKRLEEENEELKKLAKTLAMMLDRAVM